MKHGKWIKKVDDTLHVPYEKVVCSVCGKEAFHDESYGYYDDTEYCHHCGAKMDGECENCPFNTIKDCSNEEAVKEWLESEVEK